MPNTPARRAAQAHTRRSHPRSSVPNLRTADAIAVGDGTVTSGWIVERDGSHFAFDYHGALVGEFDSRVAAVNALPFIDVIGRDA